MAYQEGQTQAQAAKNRLPLRGQAKPNTVQTRGNQIMELAERLRPALLKQFEGFRDENGIPVQPARVRGIALIIAQNLIKLKEQRAG